MVILENTKYSTESELIYIQVVDTNPEISESLIDRIDSIKLKRMLGGVEETYTVAYSNSSESPSGDMILLSSNTTTDITKDDEDYQDLSLDGISTIIVTIDGVAYYSYIYDENEFYSYKVNIYKSSLTPIGVKNMTRFLFLENAMKNALMLGYIEDANSFYIEMRKIYNTFNPIR